MAQVERVRDAAEGLQAWDSASIAEELRSGRTLPSICYTDPSLLQLEQQRVLGKFWTYAGAAADVAEPGSYVPTTCGSTPAVVTRDERGELRAFANVCRHRGSLVAKAAGRRRTLQCPYHGWTYGLDGRLRRAPGVAPGFDLCRDEIALPQLAVDTWGPLLFVSETLDLPSVGTQLEPFTDAVRRVGLPIGSLTRRRQVTHRYKANWKVVIDNSLECYHCPIAHPALSRDYYVGTPRYSYDGLLHCQLIAGSRDRPDYVFGFLFPNSQLSLYLPTLMVRAIQPRAVNETSITYDYYLPPEIPADECDEIVAYCDRVVQEDIALCENVQIGLQSTAYDVGMLVAAQEEPLAWFQHSINRLIGERRAASSSVG